MNFMNFPIKTPWNILYLIKASKNLRKRDIQDILIENFFAENYSCDTIRKEKYYEIFLESNFRLISRKNYKIGHLVLEIVFVIILLILGDFINNYDNYAFWLIQWN